MENLESHGIKAFHFPGLENVQTFVLLPRRVREERRAVKARLEKMVKR